MVHRGKLLAVRQDTFRFPDGRVSEREIVVSPPACVIAAHDGADAMLIRQPREAVGEPALLELPAGRIEDGEDPLEAAKRELAEETGREAADWQALQSFYATPGFATEELHLFLATGLSEVEADPDEGEVIDLVEWPLGELGSAIEQCHDAKSLVGLLILRDLLRDE